MGTEEAKGGLAACTTLRSFGIWHLAFGIWHLAFGIWHLAFGIWHSICLCSAPGFVSDSDTKLSEFTRTSSRLTLGLFSVGTRVREAFMDTFSTRTSRATTPSPWLPEASRGFPRLRDTQ